MTVASAFSVTAGAGLVTLPAAAVAASAIDFAHAAASVTIAVTAAMRAVSQVYMTGGFCASSSGTGRHGSESKEQDAQHNYKNAKDR